MAITEVALDTTVQKFTLAGTPVLSAGRSDVSVARANGFAARVKVYAEGGENATHTHMQEEHLFFILAGQATFYIGREGETTMIADKNEGVLIPRGAFYRFESSGDENLVMFRVGYQHAEDRERLGPDGLPLAGKSEANHHVDAVAVPGKFFA